MKIHSLARFVLAIVSCCLFSFLAYADQCALTYPDGLTNSSSNGSIKFTYRGRLISNSDSILATTRVTNNGHVASCVSAYCSASGSVVPALTASFNYRSSSSNLNVDGYSTTISNNDYKDVKVKNYGTLTMSSSYSTYKFKKLKLENHGTINMTAGDYYIEDLEIKGGSVLNVIGSGTVRIYATSKAKFKEGSVINGGSGGDASKLFLYYFATGEDDKIKVESGAQVTAFMYSQGKVEIKDGNDSYGYSDVYGGISAAGEIHIKDRSWVTYQSSAVANTDFGASCTSGAATIDHYEISHDASGSTCSAETVTIKACKNADCTVLSTDLVSLDFTADGATLHSATFTGSTTFDFTHTTVETLTLAVANTSITPTRALVCSDGSGASCDIVFSSAGCSSGNTCATTFADAATNASSNGSIRFEGWGRLRYNPDTVLASKNVIHSNSIFTTCGSGNCTAGGTTVPPLTATFIANTSTDDLSVEGRTHTITNNDYQNVIVKNGGFLYMNSGYSTYRFKSLMVDYLSTVYLTAGDYYIDELEVKVGSRIRVSGSGTVRLFVKTKAAFSASSSVNRGLYGDASQLFLYYLNSGDKVQLGYATFAGFIYSKGGVELTDYGWVYGAVSAEGQILLKENSAIVYRADALENSDFGGVCNSSGSVVHHYQFEYDASGLTCKTQQVKIKACADAACETRYESESTLSLVATNGELNSVTTDLTFTKEIAVELAEILPTTIKLTMNNVSPSADLECYENGQLEASCDYKLEDSGFIFVNEDDNNLIIPSQISGKPSNIGYNKKTITLQAVQTDTTTGACTDFFANNTEVVVNLAYQCEDPGSCKVYQCLDPNNCPSNAVTITNNGETNPLKEYSSYASHNLLFGNDSKATIAITYPDAGKIKLHAQRSIVLSPDKTTDMKGTSNSFVVRPFGFYMNIGMNPGATDNSGDVFTRAGEKFDMTLSSVIWQAGEDSDNNGEPDADADLSDNPVTLNYGHEISGETVTIAAALVSPLVGNNPP
ncbi:MAG: hypothetical protein HRT35_17530, partial [Algicola sp.]|nr:hypothetical protein [Algicola sp.]